MTEQKIKSNNLIFSPAPHIHNGSSFSGAIYTIIIALVPLVIFSILSYGMDSARVIALSVASAMAAEMFMQSLFKKSITVSDGTAALTGLLLAFILPPSAQWWLVVVGSFSAIIIGKQLFGGNGYNPFNPVLVGWAIIRLSWPDHINFDIAMIHYDVQFSYEYPLYILRSLGVEGLSDFNLFDLFMGKQVGGIGAAPVFLSLIGGLFLILRGVISWRIPVFFLLGCLIFSSIFWISDGAKYANPIFHLVTGNIMIGAFFLTTDYSSSPVNKTATILFGLGCGFFTILLRTWSIYPDGVIFAILLMNILNPILDKIKPRVSGKDI